MHQVSRPPSSALAKLSPAYFGMVMATGIVSIGAWRLGLPRLAWGLFGLNLAAYGLLWLLFVARLIRYPRLFARDLVDHLQGPGFFTMVAASSILGSQFLLQADNVGAGLVLWCVAIVLWLLLTYSIFAAFTIKENKPTLDRGISGGWLLAVVATQSIAVLSALLASHVAQPYKLEMNFFALSMWLWGGMLYIWMMSLIFYRYTFFPFRPDDLSPPYWINMGAMAISTLAGSLLSINAVDAPFLLSLRPFIKGFTIFYWATGTWWIPMLLVLGVWRHGLRLPRPAAEAVFRDCTGGMARRVHRRRAQPVAPRTALARAIELTAAARCGPRHTAMNPSENAAVPRQRRAWLRQLSRRFAGS